MSAIKRIFTAVFAIFLSLCGSPLFLCLCGSPLFFVRAETPTYLRVVEEGVTLYKTPVSHYDFALFTLPRSYFLRAIEQEGGYYLVEYQDGEGGFPKIYGYVEISAVSDEYQTPSYPLFPKETLTVIKSTYVYTRPSETADLLATALDGQTVRLYGKCPQKSGERLFYYVRFGQVMGYMPAENCTPPSGKLHPDEMITPSVDAPVNGELQPQPSAAVPLPSPLKRTDFLQIILIVAVTVAVLVIVYTMFRPKKPPPRYFDDEDE